MKKTELSLDDRCRYFQMAASFCNLGFSDEQIELLTRLYDLVLEKGGKTDVHSLVKIKYDVVNKHQAIANEKAQRKYEAKIIEAVPNTAE